MIAARAELDGHGRKRFWVPFVAEEFRKPYADWIDDLVDMAQDDVARRDPVLAEEADLLQGAGAVLAVGQDRGARPAVGLGRRLEHAPVARRQPVLGARDLDDSGTERGPVHDRSRVVVGIDALRDVGREEVGRASCRERVWIPV